MFTWFMGFKVHGWGLTAAGRKVEGLGLRF